MKILLGLPQGNDIGGVGSWTRNLAVELADAGNSVSVLVHNGKGPNCYTYTGNVRLHKLAGPPADWAFRKHIAEVRRLLEADPNMVFFPNGGHCGYAAAAQVKRKHGGLKVVGIAHSDESCYYETLQYYASIIDRFIGVSYAIAGKLKDVLPSSRQNDVICLPYGVPVPDEVQRPTGAPLKLLYAGRIAEHQKRVSRLAGLSNALESMGIPFEFHLAGNGRERASLETAMRDKAVFHGPLEIAEVQALMNRCDIIVQLSDFEGTSLTMLEGMASGMVPVMSAVSGIDAVIEHGVSGFLHPVGKITEAAAQVAALHQDRALLARTSLAARRKIMDRFSIEGNARQISIICRTLLDQPSGHRVLPHPAFPMSKESRIFWAKARGKMRATFGRLTVGN
jgi:glycosyltransferase involved in cell wall biosynthesis